MRETTTWRQKLIKQLKDLWPEQARLAPADLCNIELGLYLLAELMPGAPAHILWALLTGYDFPVPEMQTWTLQQRRMLSTARYLLPYYRGKYQWQELALKAYRQLNTRFRGYEVDEQLGCFKRREVTLAADRFEIYNAALSSSLGHATGELTWAKAGQYQHDSAEYRENVEIPAELVFPPPEGHNLTNVRKLRPALALSFANDLIPTAHWMDEELARCGRPASFEGIMKRVHLEVFDRNDTLQASDILTLDGMMHLIGMVSSGKSTLMTVLAVWMARNHRRVTLVVGSVVEALNRAKLFAELGLSVAPILGRTNRERHTNRLHRILATENPLQSPFEQQHVGFHWLSTSCALDGLREAPEPLEIGAYPCQGLYTINDKGKREYVACPIYSKCAFHQAQRDLVGASIWITTSYGLIYRRIDPQLNPEQVRFLELAYRLSDLVIVDEADQVQVQLDMIFSPNQILISRGSQAWLNQLFQRVRMELDREGQAQVAQPDVARWCQAIGTASTVTTKIYALLQSEPLLQNWIDREYFSDWILFERLAEKLIADWAERRRQPESATTLPEVFETYLKDPLGEERDHPLVDLAEKLALSTNDDRTRRQIADWLREHPEFTACQPENDLAELALQLEFTLLVTVLQDRLNYIVYNWKQAEAPLRLEGSSSLMFHRPPQDYEPLIPNAPMGNILAFQYLRSNGNPNEPGQLRFFRLMGIGRWLLLHLHELFAADDIAGPHVLLLSGTSWAGSSPGQHVQVPVTGILQAPDQEIKAIEQSRFQFKPSYDSKGHPIQVSGLKGTARIAALKEILIQLARPNPVNGLSRLEQERDRLPDKRRRILLVVGSYDEAREVRKFLLEQRSDWQGQVLNLVPDDDEFESDWRGYENGLQRGLVHQFGQTGAWLLIAPLLAIERGHNILNEDYQAAIGTAYFLVRPHPRPDDIGLAIQFLNRWAIDRSASTRWLTKELQGDPLTLENVAPLFRKKAFRYWRYLLHLPMVYSTLPDYEREAVTWSQLVTIWQLIGRLIRGGSKARIYFCDAPFARRTAYQEGFDDPQSSLLVSFKRVLEPYFTGTSGVPARDRALVQTLYGPFYMALQQMKGLSDE